MKEVRTEDAVGLTLVHDITRIIKDEVKDTPFRKGHVIKKEDVDALLKLGKDHVYVFSSEDGNLVHENDAALVLEKVVKGECLAASSVREGKIELSSSVSDGVLFTDTKKLYRLNNIPKISAASRGTALRVKNGDKCIAFRIIPLMIEKEILDEVEKIEGPIAEVREVKEKTFSIITTGNEVYNKRIEDTFTPVVIKKMENWGAKIVYHVICPDNQEMITNEIIKANEISDIVLVTGGMSVDPDDRTPLAIKKTGAEIVSYGSPVLPGSMLLVSYLNGKPLLGLPGCVMYNKHTVFDLVLPYVFTDKKVTKEYLSSLGISGLCFNCDVCTFPHCHFGKGAVSEI